MTSYTNTVGGVQVQSNAPMWNANGTLGELQTSGIAGVPPPCSYTYDDLSRLQQSTCGSGMASTATTYSYDPFGNVSKTGSWSFQPTYNTATNQFQTLPNVPTGTTLYDANGNLIFDGMYTYYWDAEGKMLELNNGSSAPTWTFDALGRWVETDAPQNTFFGFFTGRIRPNRRGACPGDWHHPGYGRPPRPTSCGSLGAVCWRHLVILLAPGLARHVTNEEHTVRGSRRSGGHRAFRGTARYGLDG